MSQQPELSEEEWDHERHYMAKAGFDDLYHTTTGVDQDGKPFTDLAATITTAFGLVADGMEIPSEELAPYLAEFLKAAEVVDSQPRLTALRAALANLSRYFGFPIGP
jgi:hypothetical protein